MEIMLKNKCCLYVIISIRFFSITICILLIESPSYYIQTTILASNKHETEPACFRKRSYFAHYKTTKIYLGALFCTEAQLNEFMYVQVQLLFSKCSLCTSPLHKPDHTFGLLSTDLRNSPQQ